MTPEQIPDFLSGVLRQITKGIDEFNSTQGQAAKAGYPEYVEVQLTVTDDEGAWDHQFWVKVPFKP